MALNYIRSHDPLDPSYMTPGPAWELALVLVVFGVFYALGYKFRSYIGHRRRQGSPR